MVPGFWNVVIPMFRFLERLLLLYYGLMSEIFPPSFVFDIYLLKNDTYFMRLMRRNSYLCRENLYLRR